MQARESSGNDPVHSVALSEYQERRSAPFAISRGRLHEGYLCVWQLQRREIKTCALAKELAESRKQHSECQEEVNTTRFQQDFIIYSC